MTHDIYVKWKNKRKGKLYFQSNYTFEIRYVIDYLISTKEDEIEYIKIK